MDYDEFQESPDQIFIIFVRNAHKIIIKHECMIAQSTSIRSVFH